MKVQIPIAARSRQDEDIQDYVLFEIRCLLPGPYVMLSAFIDESGTHDGAPAIVVGGLMIKKKHLKSLDAEWKKALKEASISSFHTTDSAHLVGEFKGKNRDDVNALYRHLISLLKRHTFAGAAVACNLSESEFDDLRKGRWRFGRYATCAFICMQHMNKIALQNDYKKGSSHFLVGDFQIFGSMQERIFSLRYSSSRRP